LDWENLGDLGDWGWVDWIGRLRLRLRLRPRPSKRHEPIGTQGLCEHEGSSGQRGNLGAWGNS
jgi:hypothetical protein